MNIYLTQKELKDALKIIEIIEDNYHFDFHHDFYDHINEIEGYGSGGGCNHLFFHLKNKRVVSYHYDTQTIEYSHDKYNHIEEYLDSDDDQKGFGYESNFPKYEKRSIENIDLRVEGI